MRDIRFRAWHKIDNSMVDWKELCHNGFGSYAQNFFNRCDLILMQYTGLSDKNGVEIYEGDILHITTEDMVCLNYKTVVEWTKQGYYSDFMNYSKAKVIGNIYENKEVLK